MNDIALLQMLKRLKHDGDCCSFIELVCTKKAKTTACVFKVSP